MHNSHDDMRLLILTVKPSMEEIMMDWLINQPFEQDFSSLQISGHGSQMSGLSISEQVAGRKKQIQFRVIITQSQLQFLLENLKQEFKNSGIHYWVMPILEVGIV